MSPLDRVIEIAIALVLRIWRGNGRVTSLRSSQTLRSEDVGGRWDGHPMGRCSSRMGRRRLRRARQFGARYLDGWDFAFISAFAYDLWPRVGEVYQKTLFVRTWTSRGIGGRKIETAGGDGTIQLGLLVNGNSLGVSRYRRVELWQSGWRGWRGRMRHLQVVGAVKEGVEVAGVVGIVGIGGLALFAAKEFPYEPTPFGGRLMFHSSWCNDGTDS